MHEAAYGMGWQRIGGVRSRAARRRFLDEPAKGTSSSSDLSQVRQVERVSHHVRTGTLIGLASSAAIWALVYAGGGSPVESFAVHR